MQTKVLVLILASLAVGCSAVGGRSVSKDGRPGEPLELERLQVGSVYGVGSRFSSDGLEFAVDGFGEGLGNTEIGSSADPKTSAKQQKEAAKTMRLSHAILRCRGRHTSRLEFDYVDHGGAVALEIAGENRAAADFITLDGAQFQGVQVSVAESSTAGVRRGRVLVTGAIDRFAIAGADLELADVRLVR
ncbi:MAG TPA: hypothetical protein VK843_13205 [Planctomycetota bacterium]|nr:hypothetical protein [Planctomycetota bacterium]